MDVQKKGFLSRSAVFDSKRVVIGAPIKNGGSAAKSNIGGPAGKSLLEPGEANEGGNNRLKKSFSEDELRNPVLCTDFDRVLQVVERAGVVSASKVRSELGIDGLRLKECFSTLEDAGKIRIDYPLFGSPKLVSIAFEKEKKRRELEKRGVFSDEVE